MNLAYLSGAIGGARLLAGLNHILPKGMLTAVVSTADDLEHWGLQVCPDLDTVMYNLAGLANQSRGWGLRYEGDRVASAMIRYGRASWFQLSDEEPATHLWRTDLLKQGPTLTQATAALCQGLGIARLVHPTTDAHTQTMMTCEDGRSLPFHHWFVKECHAPTVHRVFQWGNLGTAIPSSPPSTLLTPCSSAHPTRTFPSIQF